MKKPIQSERLADGYWWFREDRFGSFSICQLMGGKWYPTAEVGPVTLEELNRRGWDLHSRVPGQRNKRR
jgi:hypothetical protein